MNSIKWELKHFFVDDLAEKMWGSNHFLANSLLDVFAGWVWVAHSIQAGLKERV